jgi:hypothetical protein
MSKRICSVCGKEKEVYGGKECPNSHFTCKDCYYRHGLKCQMCGKPLK